MRTERGLTQEEVALEAETNAGYLSRIERGERDPSLRMLKAIAEVLGTDVAALFASTKPPRRHSGTGGATSILETELAADAVALRKVYRELTPLNRRLLLRFGRVLAESQREWSDQQRR